MLPDSWPVRSKSETCKQIGECMPPGSWLYAVNVKRTTGRRMHAPDSCPYEVRVKHTTGRKMYAA